MTADTERTFTVEEMDTARRLAYKKGKARGKRTPGVGVPTGELIRVARMIEGMKQECGMDPESPTAIRNSRLMRIAAILRGLAKQSPRQEEQRSDEQSLLSVNARRAGAEMARQDGQNTACLSDLNDSALPREPL